MIVACCIGKRTGVADAYGDRDSTEPLADTWDIRMLLKQGTSRDRAEFLREVSFAAKRFHRECGVPVEAIVLLFTGGLEHLANDEFRRAVATIFEPSIRVVAQTGTEGDGTLEALRMISSA